MTISNDGATILSLLEVQHPAAKVLVELAHQQDKEVGDGTSVNDVCLNLLQKIFTTHPTLEQETVERLSA